MKLSLRGFCYMVRTLTLRNSSVTRGKNLLLGEMKTCRPNTKVKPNSPKRGRNYLVNAYKDIIYKNNEK